MNEAWDLVAWVVSIFGSVGMGIWGVIKLIQIITDYKKEKMQLQVAINDTRTIGNVHLQYCRTQHKKNPNQIVYPPINFEESAILLKLRDNILQVEAETIGNPETKLLKNLIVNINDVIKKYNQSITLDEKEVRALEQKETLKLRREEALRVIELEIKKTDDQIRQIHQERKDHAKKKEGD